MEALEIGERAGGAGAQDVPPEVLAFHQRSFDALAFSGVEDAMGELAVAFALGSDESRLTDADRSTLERLVAAIDAAGGDGGRTAVRRQAGALDVRGPTRELGGSERSLSRLEQQSFSHFGVLPAHPLQSLTTERREDLEHAVDLLWASRLSSTFGYLFSKEILDLATSPEIVERVASLLGEDLTLTATSGPMYGAPMSTRRTEWHAASGRLFGSGASSHDLNLVTVWISLNGASPETGCVKMIPGSFGFTRAAGDALEYRPARSVQRLLPPELRCIASPLGRALDGSVSKRWARQVITRTLNARSTPGMWFEDLERINPFHLSVNELFASEEPIDPDLRSVALRAQPGDCYLFSSRNLHASFPNRSQGWRKAIAFRYMATGDVIGANLADGHSQLATYKAALGESSHAHWKALDLDRRYYTFVSPRICVKGALPDGREGTYVDLATVREALDGDNGHLARLYARRGLSWLDSPRAAAR